MCVSARKVGEEASAQESVEPGAKARMKVEGPALSSCSAFQEWRMASQKYGGWQSVVGASPEQGPENWKGLNSQRPRDAKANRLVRAPGPRGVAPPGEAG